MLARENPRASTTACFAVYKDDQQRVDAAAQGEKLC